MSLHQSAVTARDSSQGTSSGNGPFERHDNENAPSHNISYIQRLPEELVHTIFFKYVESRNPPWLLTLVCRTWHNMALSLPRLWSSIFIGNVPKPKIWSIPGIAKPVQSFDHYQVCRTREDLEEMIERSGAVDLEVYILEWIFESLEVLLAPGVADRIWNLQASIPSTSVPHECAKLSQILTRTPFSRLRSIQIHESDDRECGKALFQNIITNAKGIESATLSVSNLYSLIPDIPDSFWKSLKSLHNSGLGQGENTVTALSQCKELKNLSVWWEQYEVPTLSLNNLTSLQIEIIPSYFANLSLPCLETLAVTEFSEGTNMHPWVAREATYPALKGLKVNSRDLTWMSKFHMPVLEDVAIDTTSGMNEDQDENFQVFFLGRLFTTVRILYISSGCDERGFISTLDALPNVQSVSFDPAGESAKEFGEKLVERLSEMKDGEMVCKELKELKVATGLGFPVFPIAELNEEKVKRMIDIRAEAGHPLEKMNILSEGKDGNTFLSNYID